MRIRPRIFAACTALSMMDCVLAQTVPDEQATVSTSAASALAPEPPEAVLVTGERPGPGLWKVTHGDHILWILGTHAPLAKQMIWRSEEAEALIARSQEFLVPGGVKWDIDVGVFQAVTLMPSMLKAGKIPDGGRLQDILPAEVYARWKILQRKYMPHETAERMRPSFAAQSLLNNAFISSKLEGDAGVWAALRKAARKHKVKIRALPMHEVELEVKGGRAILKEFAQTPTTGVECLATTVGRLEQDLDMLRARANAWATGDLQMLRELLNEPLTPRCGDELMHGLLAGGFGEDALADRVEQLKRELSLAQEQADREWLEATQAALAKKASTFAVMPIYELLRDDGYVSKLRASGYSVEEPR